MPPPGRRPAALDIPAAAGNASFPTSSSTNTLPAAEPPGSSAAARPQPGAAAVAGMRSPSSRGRQRNGPALKSPGWQRRQEASLADDDVMGLDDLVDDEMLKDLMGDDDFM
jgi:hypothetical protein